MSTNVAVHNEHGIRESQVLITITRANQRVEYAGQLNGSLRTKYLSLEMKKNYAIFELVGIKLDQY